MNIKENPQKWVNSGQIWKKNLFKGSTCTAEVRNLAETPCYTYSGASRRVAFFILNVSSQAGSLEEKLWLRKLHFLKSDSHQHTLSVCKMVVNLCFYIMVNKKYIFSVISTSISQISIVNGLGFEMPCFWNHFRVISYF